jgi:hypothetical protein
MEAVDLICFRCKNFRRFKGGCLAFPGALPAEIRSGQNQHLKPLKGQKNKIVDTSKITNHLAPFLSFF